MAGKEPAPSKGLTRGDFDAVRGDLKRVKVQIPRLGGHVWVIETTAHEKSEIERKWIEFKSNKVVPVWADLRTNLVCKTAHNDDGQRIWNDDEVSEVQALGSSVIQPIFDVAAPLCGFSDEDIEELEKN